MYADFLILNILNLDLPLENPVLIFSLLLFIILFAPLLLNKLGIPALIGLIIAGAIIGPNGLNLMLRDSSIVLFGTVGLMYIMFLAGLEIDLADFKKNSTKSIVFGLFGFMIPMVLGTLVGIYLLRYSLPTSVLLASMFSSHTLITYPIVSKFGIVKNRAVNISVGSTMITNILALLVLAVIVGLSTGEIDQAFWLRLGISSLISGAIIVFVFPLIGRWFIKRFDDGVAQYIFILGMVFMGAFLAEAAGIEAIIGAFLAGLALNPLVPQTSPLMNRIDFVGNALFIPFFLIGVGMLIDFRTFIEDIRTIEVAVAMTVVATAAKFVAAWVTQKTYRFTLDERRILFGLTNAQAAATLAAVLVGYNIIIGQSTTGQPVRLLDDAVLNGTILMILVTCTIASFATQKGARNIALQETAEVDSDEKEGAERILIPVSNEETVEELINLCVTVKSKDNRSALYALSVINADGAQGAADKRGRKLLDKAAKIASATDNHLHELLRYDLNVVNGITNVVREHNITDLILGLHHKKGISDSFLGGLTEGILTKCNTTTLIYKPTQPLATIKRHLVFVPDRAEREIGFPFWLIKIWNIGRNTGAKLVFYASDATLNYIRDIHTRHPVDSEFHTFDDWNDFLILARDVRVDDNLVIVMSREYRPSYNDNMENIPNYLNKYFSANSFMLVYPMQTGVIDDSRIGLIHPTLAETEDTLDDIGRTIASLFRRK